MLIEVLILVVAMTLVGVLMAWLAGFIWKGYRPMGMKGDMIASIIACIAVGLMGWFIIPEMGIAENWKYVSVATEPAGTALIVMWLFRKARPQ